MDNANSRKLMARLLEVLDDTPQENTSFIKSDRVIQSPDWQDTNQTVLGAYLAAAQSTLEMSCRPGISLSQSKYVMTVEKIENWLLLAGCLASIGRFDEAAEAYHGALTIDPASSEAHLGLVVIGRPDTGGIDAMVSIAADTSEPMKKRIAASFTLGLIFDKLGDYDKAFNFIRQANQLVLEIRRPFDREIFRKRIDRIIEIWTSDSFLAVRKLGLESELPVFIVGMPRSGTTLVEQIIASHPEAFGAGELSDIARINNLFGDRKDSIPDGLTQTLVQVHARAHLDRLQTLGGSAVRVTDKMPDNILNLGVIQTLFPNARIILCERDRRDVGLSCYFQNFGNIPWANDLDDLAFRMDEIERLTMHWRSVLPMFELCYEDLISSPEAVARRLIAFLDLKWNERCVDFHNTDRQVLTSSLWQVRQPLYASSVGRWKNYQDHLGLN